MRSRAPPLSSVTGGPCSCPGGKACALSQINRYRSAHGGPGSRTAIGRPPPWTTTSRDSSRCPPRPSGTTACRYICKVRSEASCQRSWFISVPSAPNHARSFVPSLCTGRPAKKRCWRSKGCPRRRRRRGAGEEAVRGGHGVPQPKPDKVVRGREEGELLGVEVPVEPRPVVVHAV